MTERIAIAPKVLSSGTALRQEALDALTAVRIRRGVNVVGDARLRFNDQGYPLAAQGAFAIGDMLDVRVGDDRLFAGKIHSVALDHSRSQVPELVVTAHEDAHRLTHHRAPRTWENQSTREILGRIAGDAGLRLTVDRSVTLTDRFPYLLQTGTDLALLDELVRTAGAVWWCEPGTLRVGSPDPDAGTPVELNLDEDDSTGLLSFSVRASAGQPDRVGAAGWDWVKKQPIRGEARAPSLSERGAKAESAFVRGARQQTAPGIVTNAGDPLTRAQADELAAAILVSAASDVVTGRGTTVVDAKIVPGAAVRITGAGPASGTYRVTALDHVYDPRGFHTTFHTGSLRPRGLVDTLAGGTGRPDSRVDGILVGIVTDAADPEGLGRVRVKFPTLISAEDGAISSAWARVATFDAGNGRGAIFLPEIDDEVLVAFENGNTRRPVVLGSVFGGRNKQPSLETLLDSKGHINARRMTSRAGHVVEMTDEPGKERILLQHGGEGSTITLGPGKSGITIDAAHGEFKLVVGRASLSIDTHGNITLEGMSLKVNATKNVQVDANTEIAVKATGNLSAEGLNTTIKGNATATVQGGANTAIKGATVAIN